jgi:hypothetical protein
VGDETDRRMMRDFNNPETDSELFEDTEEVAQEDQFETEAKAVDLEKPKVVPQVVI